MGVTTDALDVVLNCRNYRRFMTEMSSANKKIQESGTAARGAAAGHNANAAAMARAEKAQKAMILGGKAVAVTLAVAAVASAKLAIDYERQMTLIETQAGDTAENVRYYHREVLNLTKDPLITATPQKLAEGMYEFASVGLKGKRGLDALAVAARGAAIANNDVKDVAKAMAGAWLAGIKGAGNLENIMGILNATVGAGAAQMDELVEAMGTGVLPAAKVAGLGMTDVMGALALFTDEGYKASSAAAQMSTALHFIYSPTDKASKALASIGLSGKLLAEDMHKPRGLLTALRHLQDNMQGMSEIEKADLMAKILPGGRGRILLVLMNQLDNYEKKLNIIDKTTKNLSKSEETQAQTSANKLRHAWSRLQAELIKLGDSTKSALVPALILLIQAATGVVVALGWVGHAIGTVKKAFDGLPEPMRIVIEGFLIIAAVGAAFMATAAALSFLGSVATVAFNAITFGLFAVRYAMATNPIGFALVVIIGLILLVVKHWKWFKQAGIDVFNWFKRHPIALVALGPLAILIGGFYLIIKYWDKIKNAGRLAGRALRGIFSPIIALWKAEFLWIEKIYKKVSGWYTSAKKKVDLVNGGEAGGKSSPVLKAVGSGLRTTNPVVNALHMIGVPGFATGVEGFGGGPARINDGFMGEKVWLPSGSSVQPSPSSSLRKPRAHTPNPAPIEGPAMADILEALRNLNFNLYLDGKQITARVSKHLSDKKARDGRG